MVQDGLYDDAQWFLDRTQPDSNGCWIWTGTKAGGLDADHRYGQLQRDGIVVYAHRWSYEHFIGPIPDGMFVCHRCDVPLCVNPEHLFAGTQTDNMRDCIAKGRFSPPPPAKPVAEANWKHGNEATYVHHGCRCTACVAGARAAKRRRHARLRANESPERVARRREKWRLAALARRGTISVEEYQAWVQANPMPPQR